MFRNFLKVAIRNITRHKGFSFINIAGLTLGLTACILIGLFVWDEHQYDKSIPGGNQVYRIYNDYTNHDGNQLLAVSPPAYSSTLQNDFPEVDQTARVMMLPVFKVLFEAGKNKFYEESGYLVDSTFLEVFPIPFKYGSRNKALDDRSSIVLSSEMAERLFGSTDPVGKQVLMNKQSLMVRGVFDKDPKFHLQFNYLVPISSAQLPAERMQSWTWNQFYTYVKLKKGIDVQAMEAKFRKEVKEKSASLDKDKTAVRIPFFQPLKRIHLYSANFKFDAAKRGNITYVSALTLIATFILLIACFNFINLATAKSIQRAKEVGVRKAIGAEKKHLIFQFIGETLLLAFISVVISILLATFLLPWLNQFTNKHIPLTLFIDPFVVMLFIALTVVTGLLAGFYPALVLSRFRPVKVLKSSVATGDGTSRIPWLRHGLVVIQFTLSVVLIISAIVVFKQVNFLHGKDLGFNKDQIMFFPMRGDNMFQNNEAFKNELLKSPAVSSVSIGYGFPGDAVAGDEIIVPRNGERVSQSATQLTVDYDYIKTLGLQIIAGRDFSKAMGTDKDHAWIINETAVKQLGFGSPEKALGQTLSWHKWDGSGSDTLKTGQVIGVVRDFNYKSLYDKVETTVMQIYPEAAWKVAVKIKGAGIEHAIDDVTKAWSKFTPEFPIEYRFLDQNFEEMYATEDNLRSLLWIFTCIAIFVGCLGLFGLAAFTAERRKKEVGIRKVLGASTGGVVLLLSKNFMALVILSLIIASPVAWYFMNQWLQDFAYRINIGWWVFGLAAVSALSIAFITVSFQAIRAAIANPVKSLRTE